MSKPLAGKTVAILTTDGVEQIELTRPREEPESAGAKVELVSIKAGSIDAYHRLDMADRFDVDKSVQQAAVEDYDALIFAGGRCEPGRVASR